MSQNHKYRRGSLTLSRSGADEEESLNLVERVDEEAVKGKALKKMTAFPADASPNEPPQEDGGQATYGYRQTTSVIPQVAVTPKFLDEEAQHHLNSHHTKCSVSPKKILLSTVPILSWLPEYDWKRIHNDAISGFMVAVMNIPQGMAYAILGNLPAIQGIYMAFFPVILYSCLASARHTSMGSFAVVCLMAGKTAMDLQAQYEAQGIQYTLLEITGSVTLAVAALQAAMGILRLGALSRLLNHELVSGFTTGASIHVLTSQVRNILGLKNIARRTGVFKIILTYIDFGKHIGESNIASLVISVITLSILIFWNELLKPLVSKKIPFPIPMELVAIVAGTLFSKYLDFSSAYSLAIVGDIPTGFPEPAFPDLGVFVKALFPDALIIAFVAYAVSISMAKIFATKHNYMVDANQELIAQGASNAVGSLFGCAPISASLSRSIIQEQLGGRTQLASLFSCFYLLVVLLWVGPFFETLPTCVLASIIVVALKGMFMQVFDLPKAWAESKINGVIWIVTFGSTVVLDIEYGLGLGALLSVVVLFWTGNHPKMSLLGNFADTDVYSDLRSSDQIHELPGIKIVKYTGSLNFATGESFSTKMFSYVPIPTEKSKSKSKGKLKDLSSISTINFRGATPTSESTFSEERNSSRRRRSGPVAIRWIIVDFSCLTSIDPESAEVLLLVYKKYSEVGIQMLFARCSNDTLEVLRTCGVLKHVGIDKFFPRIHYAVKSIRIQNTTSVITDTVIDDTRNRQDILPISTNDVAHQGPESQQV